MQIASLMSMVCANLHAIATTMGYKSVPLESLCMMTSFLLQVYLVDNQSIKYLEHGVKDYVRQLKKRKGLKASS